MTKQKAKEITLEIWTYLRDHPEIKRKIDLPADLYELVRHTLYACALCKVFRKEEWDTYTCFGCPLISCDEDDSPYIIWLDARTRGERSAAAGKIVKLVAAWDPNFEDKKEKS